MSVAADLYAVVTRARRRAWSRPGRPRRLQRPVVSVGNLRVGGSGKTPTVAYLARLLADAGERPAVLSRGYARRRAVEGVVVVSDRAGVRADLDRAGDEPLMLARALPGIPVAVCPDRYFAGRLAELHLGATVHVLDDGFQHVQLDRDVNLLIVSAGDARDGRTLPSGRLREPLDAAHAAHALLVPDATAEQAHALGMGLGVGRTFSLARTVGQAQQAGDDGVRAPLDPGTPVLAVAGIARPERFFSDAEQAGYRVAATRAFRDHHRYSSDDARAIAGAARDAGAAAILTTEKDLVRLQPYLPLTLPVAWLPLDVRIEPEAEFRAWLLGEVRAAASAAGPGGAR
jgi:tetraacyldisaccharide 4'-kinase